MQRRTGADFFMHFQMRITGWSAGLFVRHPVLRGYARGDSIPMSTAADSSRDASTAAPAQPTNVRWRVVGLLMALCFISHLNRVAMSVAADERIMEQFKITPTQMGGVYSAFLLVYSLCMIPGGFFIDRFGTRAALMFMGFGSACFGALTGVAGLGILAAGQMLTGLLVIRALMGFFTTPLHPACARAVGHWTPLSQRTWANSLVTGAALLGIACTYNAFGALSDWFDWPAAFMICGALTAGLAALWAGYATDRPGQHRAANEVERRLIAGDGESISAAGEIARGSVLELLKDRSLVLLTLSYAAVGYFQYLFFYWIHYYFDTVLHLGKDQSRFYSGIPVLAMAVGMPLGGWLSDRLQRAHGRRLGLKLLPLASMATSAVLLALGVIAKEPLWIVTCFALSMGALGMSEGPFWLTAVELGGSRGGTAAAIINTGGNGIGLIAPIVTPAISAQLGWHWGIGLGGAVCLLGALCWLGINPVERDATVGVP